MKKIIYWSECAKILGLKKLFRIMKLTTVLILISIGCVFANKTYSQTKLLNPDMEKALVKDRFIVLTTEERDSEIPSVLQQKSLTGTVTDEGGQPLPGLTVLIKGTSNGTVTNVNGEYTIINVPANATLVFSFVGMLSQEVVVGNQTAINITMLVDAIGIEEVVAIGYGTQRKINLTGAIASVSAEELEDRPVRSIGQALQGVIPNLNITLDNGEPGQGANFNIRGLTSINGGSPLVLVDGVQMDPNLINPQDVKTVTVLKDASSSAIYGVRAAFGVILITTKNGQRNSKMKITLNSSYSRSKPTVLPKNMNSKDYAELMNVAQQNSSGQDYFDAETMQHIYAYYNDPENNSPVFVHSQATNPNEYTYAGNTDWAKEIYTNSFPMIQNTVALSGGSEKTSYYASYGYNKQGGLLRDFDEDFQKHNITMNINSDITPWLTVFAKTNVNHRKRHAPNEGPSWMSKSWLTYDIRPLMPVKHPDGNFSGQNTFLNPIEMSIYGGTQDYTENDTWLTGGMILKPLKNVTVNMDYTYNMFNRVFKQHVREYDKYGVDGVLLGKFPHTAPNRVHMNSTDNYYQALNIYGEYENTFNEKNYVKAMIGFNQEDKHYQYFSSQRTSLINNDLGAINQATGEMSVGGSESDWAVRGGFFRLNYAFNDKYLVEINGRYDGTSRFSKEDRFALYPSGSIGWRISEEGFMDNVSWLSNLKARYSTGTIGNQNVSTYAYISTMGSGTVESYLMGGEKPVAVYPGGLVSPHLTWEKVTTNNVGLDFGFFENKLAGSFDYFIRETKDMLTTGTPLPATMGTSIPLENAADLEVRGWEFEINWNDKLENGLTYNIGFNLSDNQAKITKFDNPNKLLSNYYVGKDIGEIWGYEANRLFQTQAEVDAHADQSAIWGGVWAPGDVQYEDLNNDGKVNTGTNTLDDPGDRKVIGNSTPRYTFGINASAEWKGFDFAMFFQGVAKRDWSTGWNPWFHGLGGYEWAVPRQHNVDYWTPDNTDAYFGRQYMWNYYGNTQVSTRYLQNASYIRLKQLTLGYTIPKTITNKVNVEKVRIYFSGENLWEKTGFTFDIFDPEVTDGTTYPLQRSFAIGLNITL